MSDFREGNDVLTCWANRQFYSVIKDDAIPAVFLSLLLSSNLSCLAAGLARRFTEVFNDA